ncbi:MAG: hypothetical protein ACRCZS_01860 [Chroococcidiopsis sp.]
MKLTGKPIYPAEIAPAAKVTAAETAITNLDAAYKAADKTLGDKNTTQDTAIAAVKTTADKAATDIAALTTTVTNNKASADTGISSAIAEWDKDRPYKVNNIVIRNKTFFLCLIANTNKDPIVDTAGYWSIFVPNESNSIFANRSPVLSDVQPAGVKWYDVSFGSDSPLILISLGNGSWQFLNQISLSRIRFYGTGVYSTYRSKLHTMKFFRADGTQIPDGHFVWGASSGLGKPTNGVAYSGQSIDGAYNSSGWAELEPSSAFDTSISISKIMGTMTYMSCTQIQFFYSNGGVKTYTAYGNIGSGNAEVTLVTLDPVLPCRYGDAIAGALGETLTATKLSDANNHDAGRITGESFAAAWNALYQQQPAVQANSLQPTIDALTARIAALEAKVP